jgi:hypothetical protein
VDSKGKAFMTIPHIVSLKIQTRVTDYNSTDTAATVADLLLKVTAIICRSPTHS